MPRSLIVDVQGNVRPILGDIQNFTRTIPAITIPIRADAAALGRITGNVKEFNASLQAASARITAFGANAVVIASVGYALRSLVVNAVEVNKALTGINAILGLSTSGLAQFGNQLFQIAKNTGQSFETVADAAQNFARQTSSAQEVLKRTSDALILTRLTGLDVADSLKTLTASVTTFKDEVGDTTVVLNKLIAVDKGFAVNAGDLAEGLTRSASAAKDAGVNFDQLAALITSTQAITQRGGAVIGNALKSIFTRIDRPETLDQLEALGIGVRNVQGQTLGAVQILTQLAQRYDTLSDAQKSVTAQLVGGLYNINILKAALGDLSSQYSIYNRALAASVNAQDAAIDRNALLNKSYSSLANAAKANFEQLTASVGTLTFGPVLKTLLGGVGNASDAASTKLGSNLGEGLLKGIGDYINGPGLVLAGALAIKFFGKFASFAAEATKNVLNLGILDGKRQQVELGITELLQKQPELYEQITRTGLTRLQQETLILNTIKLQTAALQQRANLVSGVSAALTGQGLRYNTNAKAFSAGGFIPNDIASQEKSMARSYGYTAGNVIPFHLKGSDSGLTPSQFIQQAGISKAGGYIPNAVVNTAEYSISRAGSSAVGVLPPTDVQRIDMRKAAAKGFNIQKISGKGFIPNFADTAFISRSNILEFNNLSSDPSVYNTGAAFDVGDLINYPNLAELVYDRIISRKGKKLYFSKDDFVEQFASGDRGALADLLGDTSPAGQKKFNSRVTDFNRIAKKYAPYKDDVDEPLAAANDSAASFVTSRLDKLGLKDGISVPTFTSKEILSQAKHIAKLAKSDSTYDLASSKLDSFKINLQRYLEGKGTSPRDVKAATSLLAKIKETGLGIEGFGLNESTRFLGSGGKYNIRAGGFIPNFDSSSDLYQQIYGSAPQSQSFVDQFQGTNSGDLSGLLLGGGALLAGGLGAVVLHSLFKGRGNTGSIRDVSKGRFSGGFYSKSVLDNLLGEKAVARRKKSGLISLGKSFGLDPKYLASLTKSQIANRLNIEVLKDNPAAFKELLGKGLRFDDDLKETVSGNFGILRGLGKYGDGFVPNFAFGDYIGEGAQSTVYDAGSYVFKEQRNRGLGREQRKTQRGLQLLQALINKSPNLQKMGLRALTPVKPPKALQSLFPGRGFFQEKLAPMDFAMKSGYRKASTEEADIVDDEISKALKYHNTLFNLGDFHRGNISIDAEGKPVVFDLLTSPSSRYTKFVASRGYGSGFIPNFSPLEDAISRERGHGKLPIIGSAPELGIPIGVYNTEQKGKYGNLANTIRADHLGRGESLSSLGLTGSGREQYTPNFALSDEETQRRAEGLAYLKPIIQSLINSIKDLIKSNNANPNSIFNKNSYLRRNPRNALTAGLGTALVGSALSLPHGPLYGAALGAAPGLIASSVTGAQILRGGGIQEAFNRIKAQAIETSSALKEWTVSLRNQKKSEDVLLEAKTKIGQQFIESASPEQRAVIAQGRANNAAEVSLPGGSLLGRDFYDEQQSAGGRVRGGANNVNASEIAGDIEADIAGQNRENKKPYQYDKTFVNQEERANRRFQGLLYASFGAPIAGAEIGQYLNRNGQNPQGERFAQSAGTAVGTFAQFAAFGPYGAAVGGVAAAFQLADAAIRASVPSFEDLNKAADDYAAKQKESLTAAGDYIEAQQNYAQAVKDGASAFDLGVLRKQSSALVGKIDDPDLAKKLTSAPSIEAQQKVLEQAGEVAEKNDNDKKFLADLAGFRDKYNDPGISLARLYRGINNVSTSLTGKELIPKTIDDTEKNNIRELAKEFLAGNRKVDSTSVSAISTSLDQNERSIFFDDLRKIRPEQDANISAAQSQLQRDTVLTNFQNNFSSVSRQAIAQQLLTSDKTADTAENKINLLSGLQSNRKDFTNSYENIDFEESLQKKSLQNQTGRENTAALGDLGTQITEALTKNEGFSGNQNDIDAVNTTFKSISSGSLFGNGAIKALEDIKNVVKESGNNKLITAINENILSAEAKLTDIGEKSTSSLDKLTNIENIQRDALNLENQKNFFGGSNSLLNPTDLQKAFSPIGQGIQAGVALALNSTRQSQLNLAGQNIPNAGQGLNNLALARNNQLSTAGDAAFNQIKSLQSLFGSSFTPQDQIPLQKTVEKGFLSQLKNNVVGYSDNLINPLVSSVPDVYSFRANRARQQFDQGILTGNQNESQLALNQLSEIGERSGDLATRTLFANTIQELSRVLNQIPNLSQIAYTQTQTSLGNQNVSEDLKDRASGIGGLNSDQINIQATQVILNSDNISNFGKSITANTLGIKENNLENAANQVPTAQAQQDTQAFYNQRIKNETLFLNEVDAGKVKGVNANSQVYKNTETDIDNETKAQSDFTKSVSDSTAAFQQALKDFNAALAASVKDAASNPVTATVQQNIQAVVDLTGKITDSQPFEDPAFVSKLQNFMGQYLDQYRQFNGKVPPTSTAQPGNSQ